MMCEEFIIGAKGAVAGRATFLVSMGKETEFNAEGAEVSQGYAEELLRLRISDRNSTDGHSISHQPTPYPLCNAQ